MDSIKGNYALGLTKFDGSAMPPMYLIARPPNMLPTQLLTGINVSLFCLEGAVMRMKGVRVVG